MGNLGKSICSCKRILGNNNFTVHAKKLSIFPSYMLVISFFNYCNCKCFLVFLPPSQQNQNPEQIICISYYYSSNSYLEILSWLLPQAYGSSLSLYSVLQRKQASMCMCLSLLSLLSYLVMAKLMLWF